MKKYIIIAIIAMAMVLPAQGFANYLIILKNGNELVTKQYWEDGDQIKFYGFGGIAGVGKCNVRKIEQTTQDAEKEMISDALPAAIREEMKNPEKQPAQHAVAGKTIEKGVIDQPLLNNRDEGENVAADTTTNDKILKDPYIQEFENLKQEFDDVRGKGDAALYTYAKEITGFRDKILNERLGQVYSEQLVEVYSLLAEVESAVNAK